MGVGMCFKCGLSLEARDDIPPTQWCLCPPWDTTPYPDELMDPSEDEYYYSDYSGEYPED